LNWRRDYLIVIVASLLAVLFIYLILYCASLVILKPIIGQWNVTAVAFRPIVNSTMLIIYVISPFNAYEALILHVGIFQYFALSVFLPTAILALILMLVPVLCQVDCEAVGRLFLIHSFALALATSYITSFIIWLKLGKPGIGTSIYMEFTLASAIYVTLYSTAALLKRLLEQPRSLRHLLMRFVTRIVPPLSVFIVIIVSVAYLMFKLLPPTPPHRIGLALTVIIYILYSYRHFRNWVRHLPVHSLS